MYYEGLAPTRVRVHVDVKHEARGTADAVAAAESFVGDRRFVAINGDNHYDAGTLWALCHTAGTALAGHDRTRPAPEEYIV